MSQDDTAAAKMLDYLRSQALYCTETQQPEEEDYDDTESAYGNGEDVATWRASKEAHDLLRSLGCTDLPEPLILPEEGDENEAAVPGLC